MKIFQWIEKKLYRLDGSTFNFDNDIINRQRRFVLRSTTGIIVAGAMLNLAGLTGIDAFRIPNIVFLAITLTSYFLTRHGKLSLLAGLYVVFMAALSDLSGEMLYLCFSGNKEITYYILADCILYAALMAMTIVTYMPITTVISFCIGGICYGIIMCLCPVRQACRHLHHSAPALHGHRHPLIFPETEHHEDDGGDAAAQGR